MVISNVYLKLSINRVLTMEDFIMKLIHVCPICNQDFEREGTPDSVTSEILILRAFVQEFSPFHQNMINDLSYTELTGIVKDVADEM